MRTLTVPFALSLLLAALGYQAARAEFIASPVGVVRNDLGEWIRPGNGITNAIDHSGLSVDFVSGVSDLDAYLALSPTHESIIDSTMFVSGAGTYTGNIDFDLGARKTITSFVLWQQTRWPLEQIDTFRIFTSEVSDFSVATDVGAFTAFAHTVVSELAVAQRFELTESQGQFVRLQILSNHGNNFSDLGEVAFGVAAVPEPSGLLLGAFAFLGLLFAKKALNRQA